MLTLLRFDQQWLHTTAVDLGGGGRLVASGSEGQRLEVAANCRCSNLAPANTLDWKPEGKFCKQVAAVKPFPDTPEFLAAARRIIWFKKPEESLQNPIELMAYAMKHSLEEDMALLLDHVKLEGLREAIEKAPAGIIGEHAWLHWNGKAGFSPPLPMPKRTLPS
jgi:hypothetical protein